MALFEVLEMSVTLWSRKASVMAQGEGKWWEEEEEDQGIVCVCVCVCAVSVCIHSKSPTY